MGQFSYSRGKWSDNEFNQLLAAIGQIPDPDHDSGWIAAVTAFSFDSKVLPRRVLIYQSDNADGSAYGGLLPDSVSAGTVALTPTKAYIRVIIDL